MPDLSIDRISGLIGMIYGSFLDPVERPHAIGEIAKAFDAASCQLHIRDTTPTQSVTIIGATQNCLDLMPAYAEYYHDQDEWSLRGLRLPDRAVIGPDLISEEELIKGEFYNDLLRKAEVHHLVGATFSVDQTSQGCIGIHRAPGAREFDAGDRSLMNLLLPHLGQALRLMRLLENQERERLLGFDALAALSVGVFVVGADCRLRQHNASAERLLQAGMFRLDHGRLALCDSRLDTRLWASVRAAVLAASGRSLSAGDTIVLTTSSYEKVPLMVTPVPARALGSDPLEPLVAIFVGEPGRVPAPLPELIRMIFGLTPAEARLAAALLNGCSLSEYADEAGLSIHTVRSQVKSIFEKSHCRGQSDFVRVLGMNPILRFRLGYSTSQQV